MACYESFSSFHAVADGVHNVFSQIEPLTAWVGAMQFYECEGRGEYIASSDRLTVLIVMTREGLQTFLRQNYIHLY